jgi:hypothetical protein
MRAGLGRHLLSGLCAASIVAAARPGLAQEPPVDKKAIAEWTPDRPVPAGYHPIQRVRGNFITAGAVIFGITFFATFAAALLEDLVQQTGWGALLIPGVGPFLATTQQGGAPILVLDGAVQSLGIVLFTVGIVGRTILVPNEPGAPAAANPLRVQLGAGSSVEVVPMLGMGMNHQGQGIGATLTF